ncbi:DUF1501 domain-containing protein [Lentisphaera profundi]|uniref:DUF1501 domain-containing protein n=1 Tax=Lentisphaera profundi TaxID=1658616 RepID=A0ABY7VQZ9_9BACT|nr:DUF1501 domain-containing protein [Lentisphaera profundi]WDE95307.1 DUF1501 domain-containing protein [Lentisphaera profundi]
MLNRRNFLKSSAVIGGGASLPLFGSEKNGPRAKSVIHIYLPGGLSAQESFDPKPYNPSEYRGPYSTISTKLTGERFSENLRKTAQIADKICVIRSMTHGEAAHERGTHNMLTGYRPNPAVIYPSLGSITAHQLGSRNNLPPYICIPKAFNEFSGRGFLSSAYSPFSTGGDPSQSNFKVQNLQRHGKLSEERFDRRKAILADMNKHSSINHEAAIVSAMEAFNGESYDLMNSPSAVAAFDLSKENNKTKDWYGRNQTGQRMLLARRLVEAGSRYVALTAGGWDHHDNIRDGIRKSLPPLDQAFAALIKDLDQRGLLDSTLVILNSEFGRTPKINKTGGRDHYPKVFSMVMAGGGIKRGLIHGKSDTTSSMVEEKPVHVADYARTVYTLMGIDPDKAIMSPGDRPVRLVYGGQVINDILA